MEYALLYKVGLIVSGIVKGGYILSAGYLGATAVRYVKDYKSSVERDKVSM